MSCAKTGGPILTMYTSYDAVLHKKVPFEEPRCDLRCKIPPKKAFLWGVNRHFQAEHAMYRQLHIVKTTASIPTICFYAVIVP